MKRRYETSFGGISCFQLPEDFYLWELFFNRHHVKTCIELGTGAGGFSLYLAAQCCQRGIKFVTFDHQDWLDHSRGLAARLFIRAVTVDIFSEAGILAVRNEIDSLNPIVLFCDDGDKPREWREFFSMLAAGDFIAVHDWGTEFVPRDLGTDLIEDCMEEECETVGSMTRWFKKL